LGEFGRPYPKDEGTAWVLLWGTTPCPTWKTKVAAARCPGGRRLPYLEDEGCGRALPWGTTPAAPSKTCQRRGRDRFAAMPADIALKFMNLAHRVIHTVSGNRLGWDAMNMPVLELTTVGRKTGQPREKMLTAPVVDGDTLVIVASRGGDDKHPAWFHNLSANPDVEVRLKGRPKVAMHAHVATAEERAELWPRVIKDHKNYAGYQKRTAREIPLVLLQPR
jgi:deazaflavin-dependent oxidoreductase (nitroreductase family)